jgi:protein-S-isoprenylcysteine O-methyltransferase Ste14
MTDPAPDHPPDHPNVIARPPRIYLSFMAAGFALDLWRPIALIPEQWLQNVLGGLLITAGGAISSSAFKRFMRAGTNIPTPLPATALVTEGIYAMSRNPIYVSMSLIHAGVAVAADNIWLLGLLIPLLIIMRYGVIGREEAYLEDKFGEDYVAYKSRVRRWL